MPETQDDHSWIGRRIARLRRERGWTLAALGDKVGLSSTQLSRIESGTRQASVGTLIEIARAFGVSLSELVADEERASPFQVFRLAERKPRNTANGILTPLSGRYPGLEAVHLTILASAEAPTAQHVGEEWLYVLTGMVQVAIGATTLTLEPGDAVHFPSHAPHSLRGIDNQPAEVLLITTRAN
ncbi:helix-turn-helix domain-containing protein [Nocardia callitridis]|uniref:helix-turn-helix domain-containing protein n=1 Tax=Nocardia callitridis TaxID=648753 RepID=UPI0031E6504A